LISALIAAALTVGLAELGFDVDDTAYWRRWLGNWGYRWRRCLLALVPFAVGAVVSLALEPVTTITNPYVRGVVGAAIAWAILRADTSREALKRHVVATPAGPGTVLGREGAAQVMSALVLIYDGVRVRLDKRTGQKVDADLARQRDKAPIAPEELMTTAEELASHVRWLAHRPDAKKRDMTVAQNLEAVLYEHMDILVDPLAQDRQRSKAAFSLAEVLSHEFKARRWYRPAANRTEAQS
jgi:hypothetical protein